MATVQQMWAKRDTYSARASEIARTLCLSGLAVVWIFRTPTPSGSTLTPALLWASGLIVTALFLDLLQYVVGSDRSARIARRRERELKAAKKPANTPVFYPRRHAAPMRALWWAKIVIVLVAWTLLLVHVVGKALSASLPVISP